jgi:isocitrate/isopropylmalate dehydrogenase
MGGRRYTVACLAGNGLGPELMAQASRALAAAARPHGFVVDEVHAPFGSEAFMQVGHPLPPSTRRACREADVVLAVGPDPALSGVEADLDLRAGITRVLVPGKVDLCLVSPLDPSGEEWTAERAAELACSRRGRLALVGTEPAGRTLAALVADVCPGLQVERVAGSRALAAVATQPEQFDVVVCEARLADALALTVAFADAGRTVAFGRLAQTGPGVFFPDDGFDDDAGQGTAPPGSMLLAAALALGEGLRERAAARTLEGAFTAAYLGAAGRHSVATTREVTDAVLAVLPSAIANAEFFQGAAA